MQPNSNDSRVRLSVRPVQFFFCVVVLAGMTVLVGDLAGTRILLTKIRARKQKRSRNNKGFKRFFEKWEKVVLWVIKLKRVFGLTIFLS